MTPMFDAPVINVFGKRHFSGLLRRYTMQTRGEIPSQWIDYNAERERGPGDYFGLSFNFAPGMESFDYLCGQEVGATEAMVSIEGAYARFATRGHISTMQSAWEEVFHQWLGPRLAGRQGPSVEYYPPEFDGMTGAGGYEIWVPVVAK